MANEFKVKKGLIVQGSGSVGDNTILDVQGNQGQLFSITDSLSGSLFSVSDISGIPILEVFSDDTVKIGTFGSEGIIVNGSNVTASANISASGTGSFGMVGIGTTTPAQKLDVKDGFIQVSGSSASGYGYLLNRAGQDTYSIRHLDGGLTINNETDNRKEMTFDGNGNVGIGATSPTAKLHVSGNIWASGSNGNITASANISASGNGNSGVSVANFTPFISASREESIFYIGDNEDQDAVMSMVFRTEGNNGHVFKFGDSYGYPFHFNNDLDIVGSISASGNITSSGNISASGLLFISASQTTGQTYGVLVRDSATGRVYYTGSYGTGGGGGGFTAAGISGSLGTNATLIRSLTAAGISGSLGTNAPLIRSLTAAGISGSWQGQNFISASQTFLSTGQRSGSATITGSLFLTGSLRVIGNSILSGSLIIRPIPSTIPHQTASLKIWGNGNNGGAEIHLSQDGDGTPGYILKYNGAPGVEDFEINKEDGTTHLAISNDSGTVRIPGIISSSGKLYAELAWGGIQQGTADQLVFRNDTTGELLASGINNIGGGILSSSAQIESDISGHFRCIHFN
jgi:hypothetical protein